jgi:hypothetical protein
LNILEDSMLRKNFFIYGIVALLLTVPPQVVRADGGCGGDDENEAKALVAAARKAEKSGKPAELFIAYGVAIDGSCPDIEDAFIRKAQASLPKLGRDLAKVAEAKGLLYSKEPVYTIVHGNISSAEIDRRSRRANERASAFAWLEAVSDYNEANRVMLKAVHAKSDNLELFNAAWEADGNRYTSDSKTGERKPYASPAAYRQELQKIASANADRFMKAEEKDAAGLSGSANDVGMVTMNSMDKLRKASEWMKFLPGSDKPARERAEQRGDTILKRSDPTFTRMNATAYYEFSGSPKAKEKLAQLEKKSEESAKAMEKSARKMEGVITEKSATDQKKFDKGKANLEKELGF